MQNGEEEEDEWAGTLGSFRQMAGRRRGGDLKLMGKRVNHEKQTFGRGSRRFRYVYKLHAQLRRPVWR